MNVYQLHEVLQFLNKDKKYLNKRFDLMTKEINKERKTEHFDRKVESLTIDMNTLKDGEKLIGINGDISCDLYNNGQKDFWFFKQNEQIEIFHKYIAKVKSIHKDEMIELDTELDDMRDLVEYRLIEVSQTINNMLGNEVSLEK